MGEVTVSWSHFQGFKKLKMDTSQRQGGIIISNMLTKSGNNRGKKFQCELNSALIYTEESGHFKGRMRA